MYRSIIASSVLFSAAVFSSPAFVPVPASVSKPVPISAPSVPVVPVASEKISLNFQKIPLSEALTTYADYTKQNLVIDSKLIEIVDMRLNQLTAKQVLNVLVDMYDLHVLEHDNVLMIMRRVDFENRNQSRRSLVIPVKYLSANDVVITLQTANSSHSMSAMAGQTQSIQQNSLSVNLETNSIVLQGNAAFIERNQDIIKSLDISQMQIKVSAKLMIVSVSDLENLGLKLKTFMGDSSVSGVNTLVDLGVAASSTFSFFISKAGKFLLDLELDALKQNGLVSIISAPHIFTISNKTASIEQGIQIPFQVQDQNNSFHTEFKDASLRMAITPRYSGDSIFLDVFISKDSVGDVLNKSVSIEKRQIKSNVNLRDGETVILGGIVEDSKTYASDRVPFISDLPYIGDLFKRRSNNDSEKRLVIFITPELVRFPPVLPFSSKAE